MGVGGQHPAPAALPPGKRLDTPCTGGWVGPRALWTGAEYLALTGLQSQDRPARSESLYRQRRDKSFVNHCTFMLKNRVQLYLYSFSVPSSQKTP